MANNKEPKIAFIGAGSPIWTGRICADLAGTSELGQAEMCLHDIDEEGLSKGRMLCDTNAERDAWRQDREALRNDQIADREPLPQLSHHDNVVPIIAALEGHGEYAGVMNMPNVGQMPDLPLGAVVETQCHVDSGGIHPLAGGPLPGPVHTLVAGHVERYEMSVESAVTGDAALAVAALASDPQLTDPISAKPMVHQMLERSRQWLPQF